ncbi:CpsD/CapB family tyrosine-protein kinase [Paenibacillus senegalensis]|uniref:CpsD/CapB family tyrosine-protein kinase n=1 Tax=Paenibacillus senegalensis TaxID=1465766 RepID=UPI0002DE6892|nr:CpsD/CapB family tyrosine-protein kinase [Paenibacillus senegalensis]
MSRSTDRRPIITQTNPKSPISEAYRTLRTNVDFSSIDEELQVVMVTSAGPGEGKSTTVTNLAVTYAQSERKVLIIDADLRKPTMHHTFVCSNRIGLTTILIGKAAWQNAVQETGIPGLEVITSGPVPPNPSEILASQRMRELLQELKQHYDLVLLDTPPALVVTDAQITATQSDGILLVLNSGKVKREHALKAKANLEHVKGRVLGIVLNNVERKGSDSHYYYYYGSQ